MEKIVFLDRDGVINQDSADYIKSPEEFQFIPNSPEAIALLNRNGFNVIVITNQSAIGRKMISKELLDHIFNKMKQGVQAAGGSILDVFFCPHTPDKGCSCRKPSAGLILEAWKKYRMNLEQAVMVGDSAKDILCGRNAGCGRVVLVQTGNGQAAQKQLLKQGMTVDYLAADLYAAACWIIGK